MDRINRERQHVSLPTAAALVCFEATGITPDASKPEALRELLNDMAHVISNLAAIYATDPLSGLPAEISSGELLGATFARGAHLLITADGKHYRGLTVLRLDINAAIVILKRAGFALRTKPG